MILDYALIKILRGRKHLNVPQLTINFKAHSKDPEIAINYWNTGATPKETNFLPNLIIASSPLPNNPYTVVVGVKPKSSRFLLKRGIAIIR